MCDEEPGIGEIKPFLRERQKEVRKRLSREDHGYAAASAIKRQKNLRELHETALSLAADTERMLADEKYHA